MTLEDLGYTPDFETYRKSNGLEELDIARVIAEHKERYIVLSAEHEYEAEILGNLRYTAQSRTDFPAVGDWVAISKFDESKVIIHAILPRKSILSRQSIKNKGEKQLIASNIDFALIVQSIDRDFNINRIERYLTICHEAKIEAKIIISKIDLLEKDKVNDLISKLKSRINNIPIFSISNTTGHGIHELSSIIHKGKTYCLLGSSGVGKSTLLNSISGEPLMKTNEISDYSQRGKHITTHRELKVLDKGGILIDNPGMRELGITDASKGIETTFQRITELANDCKYKDCTHTNETGCAVLKALDNGDIQQSVFENFQKLQREKAHYESSVAERRQKEKDFGKKIKYYKKRKKFNRE